MTCEATQLGLKVCNKDITALTSDEAQVIAFFTKTALETSIIQKFNYVTSDTELGTIKLFGKKAKNERLILSINVMENDVISKEALDKCFTKISKIKNLKSIAIPNIPELNDFAIANPNLLIIGVKFSDNKMKLKIPSMEEIDEIQNKKEIQKSEPEFSLEFYKWVWEELVKIPFVDRDYFVKNFNNIR